MPLVKCPLAKYKIFVIMTFWRFMDYVEAGGRNPVAEWMSELSVGAQTFINTRLALMESLPRWPEKWASDYRGWPGLNELRITHKRIPYRPLFTFGSERGTVILLCGSIEQNGKLPRRDLETAQRRRKEHLAEMKRAQRHRFEAA